MLQALKEAIDYIIIAQLLLLFKKSSPLPSFLIDISFVDLINFPEANWNVILDIGLLRLLKVLLYSFHDWLFKLIK